VRRAAFVSAVTPYLLKAADNPAGVDLGVFDGIRAALNADRVAFLSGFIQNFYNADVLRGTRLSDEALRLSWTIAAGDRRAASAPGRRRLADVPADVRRLKHPTASSTLGLSLGRGRYWRALTSRKGGRSCSG
jgi:hypothetical protein